MSVRGVERVAEDEALGVLDEGGDVVVVDVVHHVEALGRGADLAGVEEGGPGAAAGGDLELVGGDVGADDERVLAAHLEVDAGDPLGAGERRPCLPVATEPVKAMQSTRSSAAERGADVARAGEQVDDAGRQVLEAAGQHQGRERRQLRGLADDAVAGRERRRELPGEQQQRVVPGDDAADDAERVLDDHRQLGRLDRRDHPAGAGRGRSRRSSRRPPRVHSTSSRFSISGLPPSAVIVRRQLVGALAQPPRDLVQHLAALDRRGPRPAARRPRGRRRPRRRAALPRRSRPSRSSRSCSGFSTASGSPAPATGSPPISSERVVHAAEPALETGSRPAASALRPASSVSSGRISASFSARRCCQVAKRHRRAR